MNKKGIPILLGNTQKPIITPPIKNPHRLKLRKTISKKALLKAIDEGRK